MWPYGGNLSAAELAEKFGWPSIVVSVLLLPFSTLYCWLLAFPPWCSCLRREVKVGLRYTYPEEVGDSIVREKIYGDGDSSNESGACSMVIKADPEGGLWFERYWGLFINVLNLEVVEENRHWRLSPNCLSWFRPSVDQLFEKEKSIQALTLGIQIQPFCFLTFAFVLPAVLKFATDTKKWLNTQDANVELLQGDKAKKLRNEIQAGLESGSAESESTGSSSEESGADQRPCPCRWNCCSICCCCLWLLILILVLVMRGVQPRDQWPEKTTHVTLDYNASTDELFKLYTNYPKFFGYKDNSAIIQEEGEIYEGNDLPVGDGCLRKISFAGGKFNLHERIQNFTPTTGFRYHPEYLSGPVGDIASNILYIPGGVYTFEDTGDGTLVTWNTTNRMPFEWQLNALDSFLSAQFLSFMVNAKETLGEK